MSKGIVRKKRNGYAVYKIMADGSEKLKGLFPTIHKARRYLKGFKK